PGAYVAELTNPHTGKTVLVHAPTEAELQVETSRALTRPERPARRPQPKTSQRLGTAAGVAPLHAPLRAQHSDMGGLLVDGPTSPVHNFTSSCSCPTRAVPPPALGSAGPPTAARGHRRPAAIPSHDRLQNPDQVPVAYDLESATLTDATLLQQIYDEIRE